MRIKISLKIFVVFISTLIIFIGSTFILDHVFSVVSATTFGIGDTVEVQNTAAAGGLAVRSTPAGNEIARMPDGTQGEIIGGPQHATLRGTTFTWWRIQWTNGQVGWSAERYPGGVWYLRKVIERAPTPQITRVEPAQPNITPGVRHPFIIHGSGFVDGAIVTLESPADKLYYIPRTHNPFINIQPNRIEVEAGFYVAGNWRV